MLDKHTSDEPDFDLDAKRSMFAWQILGRGLTDMEAWKTPSVKKSPMREISTADYGVGSSTKLFYLCVWFLLNLSLTLYNKAVLKLFPYPWLLTSLHSTFVSVGILLILSTGAFEMTKLNTSDTMLLMAFSCLFTLNIAISNVSLALVSVPFHQTVRATSPVWIIVIQRVFLKRSYSIQTYLSNFIIVLGVMMVAFGEYFYTTTGFLLTLLGVVLASAKGVLSNRLMTGRLALPALEILLRLSPLAALQALAYAYFIGEYDSLVQSFELESQLSLHTGLFILGNGIIAFAVNFFSFQTNKRAGALSLSIAGNLKQFFTVLLGIVLFKLKIGWLNGCGMVVTLGGAAWYSCIEFTSRPNT